MTPWLPALKSASRRRSQAQKRSIATSHLGATWHGATWCHMVSHGATWCHMVKRLTAPLHLTPLLLLLCTKKNTHTHTRTCVCVLYIIYNCKIIVYTHTYIYHNVRVVVGLVGMECDTPSSPIVCQFSRDSWFL